ncbi:Maf family protein [Clostridium facile]|uniref:dTTP/UTP pyrophosphatase n=1 Tax=Clostridium facile TaxID=2763035 RepID=A0ABR7IT00_9CLOT|nr:Maf family protein [Clostridium facile]MBC5788265.1 septum formation inhibitor Maf [Clostridium facile]
MILASKSPRRKELIQRICKDVKIIPSGVDESLVAQKPVEYFAERLARAKADQVAQEHPDELVVGCDTVVILDGEVLGKPENKQHTFEMLSRLSGNTHKVITGVAMIQGDKTASFSEITEVTFYQLTEQEIKDYIDTNEPFDKAGGYGIQGQGCLLVKKINGDYYNVVGLPVSKLSRELNLFVNRK